MRNLKLVTLLGLGLLIAPYAHAQRIGVEIGVAPGYVGPAPVCPYGYYDYYPYACAPYGYYGSTWFSGGIFIGAGPWGHGYRAHPGVYAGRGYYAHGPLVRDQGSYGRGPALPVHPAFRGGNGTGHFNAGAAHGNTRGGVVRGGASGFHDGAHR
jgi:hypothetical protein